MRVIAFFTLLLSCTIIHSARPLEGWYSGLMLSGTYASSLSFNATNPFTRTLVTGRISYNSALNGGGQLGYRYDKYRFEVGLFYNHNDYRKLDMADLTLRPKPNVLGLSGRGNTHFYAALFNVFYEIYDENREVKFVPYFGLGGGVGSVTNTYRLIVHDNPLFSRKDEATVPLGQAIIGLSYFFTDSFSTGLDFRYIGSPQHQTLKSRIAISSINFIVNLLFT